MMNKTPGKADAHDKRSASSIPRYALGIRHGPDPLQDASEQEDGGDADNDGLADPGHLLLDLDDTFDGVDYLLPADEFLLDKQMGKALAEHQGSLSVGVRS